MARTETREKILSIIEQNGEIRPVALREVLGFSGPAIHRHLQKLLQEGRIERKGTPPSTRYSIAGVPDFSGIFAWLKAKALASSPPAVSETRDVVAARLPRLKDLCQHGLSPSLLPLVIATVGEVANNSFDHNLGQWHDVPGCWCETQVTGRQLWICIADRGQGIRNSLAHVLPDLLNDQAALEAAFSQQISGRAPELRGNGLKFVKDIMMRAPGRGLGCHSGNGIVDYGDLGPKCAAQLRRHLKVVKGTVTILVWGLA